MNVLMTMPFGSRLYGTFDENSDWDWKKVILPPLDDLLVGVPIKNKFFSSSADTIKNTSDDTDTELIPIQTFARDVLEGQTYALEILYAVLQQNQVAGLEVYHPWFKTFCETLEASFVTSNINAMVGYAYHQAELYSDKGNRLEKLHQFAELLNTTTFALGISPESKLSQVIDHDRSRWEPMVDKMFYLTTSPNPDGSSQVCFSLLEKLYPENITIDEAKKRVETNIKKYGRRANQAMDNKGKDWKAISHALRVVYQALDVLEHKWIDLPFTAARANLLKDIKYGKVAWEEVQIKLVEGIDQITELQKVSKLPEKTEELSASFQVWLKNEMALFYGV